MLFYDLFLCSMAAVCLIRLQLVKSEPTYFLEPKKTERFLFQFLPVFYDLCQIFLNIYNCLLSQVPYRYPVPVLHFTYKRKWLYLLSWSRSRSCRSSPVSDERAAAGDSSPTTMATILQLSSTFIIYRNRFCFQLTKQRAVSTRQLMSSYLAVATGHAHLTAAADAFVIRLAECRHIEKPVISKVHKEPVCHRSGDFFFA